jgi:hypothetical protein
MLTQRVEQIAELGYQVKPAQSKNPNPQKGEGVLLMKRHGNSKFHKNIKIL